MASSSPPPEETASEAPRCDDAAAEQVGRDALRTYLREMQSIRRFEERAARDYASGFISGFCHLYIGQEAVAVGALGALEARDHVVTAYRDHGHALLRGCSPRSVMAELYGKVTGAAKGRGGSMHMFNPEQGFHGGHGIVGGHIPLAAGFAFASKYEQRGEVAICFFGDGAMNQGAFYESLNLAALWDLPALFVIENNDYAMGTPLSRASASKELAKKADAFDMAGVVVDGMDVCLMHTCIAEAAKRAREDGRPTLIEAQCYRYRGHSMSDPQKYRTKEEVAAHKAHDPILLATNTLLHLGWASSDEIKAWDKEAKDAAADASAFAKDSPQPRLADVGKYVYANEEGWAPDEAMTPHIRDEHGGH